MQRQKERVRIYSELVFRIFNYVLDLKFVSFKSLKRKMNHSSNQTRSLEMKEMLLKLDMCSL